MASYATHDNQFTTRRVTVFGVILALHALVIWMIASGVARRIIETVAPPIQTDIIEEVKERDTPPPPPPPEFERPPVEVPPPEVSIDIPVETTSTAITDVTDRPVPKAPPPPPAPRNVVKAKMGKNFPNSEDYYPAAAKRLSEEGSITVKVCVGPTGKLAEEPTVTQSSGNARLDEGALKLAKAGRYVAGSVDGQPTTDCFPFRVKFELKN